MLAVSLTPHILTVLIKKLEEQYTKMTGIYLLLLSMAGSALTLWGTGTILVIVLVPLFFSLFRREKNWKHLLYASWSLIMPILVVGYYYLYRLAI